MKVKVFTGKHIEQLEREINEWLKENYNKEIKHILQSESDTAWTISIWYEDWS